jgi:hypothetical protein
MKFEDLKFEKWRKEPSYWMPLQRLVLGKRASVRFNNGYVVSVILGNEDDDSYSNGVDTYEVAVFNSFNGDALEGFGEDGVKKYATKEDVESILAEVEVLPLAPIMTKEVERKSLSEETAQGLFEQIKKMCETLKKYKEL